MFYQLTKYLSIFKNVSIPAIGTFKIVQVPASFDVVDKLIHPPTYSVQFSPSHFLPDHQLAYLAGTLQCPIEAARDQLEAFGAAIRNGLQQKPLEWNGFGTLELVDATIQFHALPQAYPFLLPVPANKVIRTQAQHTVLVGEREVIARADQDKYTVQEEDIIQEEPKNHDESTTKEAYITQEGYLPQERKRPYVLIIGWILVLLAAVFIGYHFYIHGWKPASAGYQDKIQLKK